VVSVPLSLRVDLDAIRNANLLPLTGLVPLWKRKLYICRFLLDKNLIKIDKYEIGWCKSDCLRI